MEQTSNLLAKSSSKLTTQEKVLCWIGALFLLVVAYVHLALSFTMIGFNHLLGTLFLLNGVGAFIAMIGVLKNARWIGWVFGILMSGGAAAVKIAMNLFPGVGALLMGMPSGRRMSHPPATGHHGGAPGAHLGGGQMHSVLPLFTNINTLATISIVIEIAFVVIAIYAHFVNQKRIANQGK